MNMLCSRAGSRLLPLICLLVLGCAAPFFERARVTEGFSAGGGVGAAVGNRTEITMDDQLDVNGTPYVAPDATVFARYGFSPGFGIFLQASSGLPRVLGQGADTSGLTFLDVTQIRIGGKVAPNERDAYRFSIGVPPTVEAAWLHDFNPGWTSMLGAGLAGVVMGIGTHWQLSPTLAGHAGLSLSCWPIPGLALTTLNGQFGFAIEAFSTEQAEISDGY
jgi:hypothetical protein